MNARYYVDFRFYYLFSFFSRPAIIDWDYEIGNRFLRLTLRGCTLQQDEKEVNYFWFFYEEWMDVVPFTASTIFSDFGRLTLKGCRSFAAAGA
jgi:hypothetical protein